jgi:hypothetical protein
MTAILELQHNGTNWVLNVTPEDGEGLEIVEIAITDAEKEALELQGCEIYEP